VNIHWISKILTDSNSKCRDCWRVSPSLVPKATFNCHLAAIRPSNFGSGVRLGVASLWYYSTQFETKGGLFDHSKLTGRPLPRRVLQRFLQGFRQQRSRLLKLPITRKKTHFPRKWVNIGWLYPVSRVNNLQLALVDIIVKPVNVSVPSGIWQLSTQPIAPTYTTLLWPMYCTLETKNVLVQ